MVIFLHKIDPVVLVGYHCGWGVSVSESVSMLENVTESVSVNERMLEGVNECECECVVYVHIHNYCVAMITNHQIGWEKKKQNSMLDKRVESYLSDIKGTQWFGTKSYTCISLP